jgi:hypothetical protein
MLVPDVVGRLKMQLREAVTHASAELAAFDIEDMPSVPLIKAGMWRSDSDS